MTELTIRACRLDETGAVIDIWKRTGLYSEGDTAEALLRHLSDQPGMLLLALSGGNIIGTAMGGWDGWRATYTAWRYYPNTAVRSGQDTGESTGRTAVRTRGAGDKCHGGQGSGGIRGLLESHAGRGIPSLRATRQVYERARGTTGITPVEVTGLIRKYPPGSLTGWFFTINYTLRRIDICLRSCVK